MTDASEILFALVGLAGTNGVVLAAIVWNSIRIGRLQGRLDNGDYLRCPFYRGDVNGKRSKSNKKASSCRET